MNPMSATLSPEADRFLADVASEFNAAQHRLEERWNLSSYVRWEFDPGTGELELHYEDGSRIVATGQLLGTYSVSGGTFEWAWNSPHFKRSELSRDSKRVRDLGKQLDISYLQAGMVPVPGDVFLSFLCGIGLKAVGAEGVFRGSAGDVHPILLLTGIRRA